MEEMEYGIKAGAFIGLYASSSYDWLDLYCGTLKLMRRNSIILLQTKKSVKGNEYSRLLRRGPSLV
jgi:hypothetical protein